MNDFLLECQKIFFWSAWGQVFILYNKKVIHVLQVYEDMYRLKNIDIFFIMLYMFRDSVYIYIFKILLFGGDMKHYSALLLYKAILSAN